MALAGSTLALALLCWLSTGTLAPYAATLPHPWEMEGTIVNYDHHGYEWNHRFVTGPRAGLAVRNLVGYRLLLYAVGWPVAKLLGFHRGYVLVGAVLNLAGYVLFVLWARRRWGERAGLAAMALLCAYPGVFYWVGLPYAQSLVVPASLGVAVLADAMARTRSRPRLALQALGVGVLFTAYDLAPLFLPAVLLMLAWQRRFLDAALALPALVAPPVAVAATIHLSGFLAGNTEYYRNVIDAYLEHAGGLAAWWKLASQAPKNLALNYLCSNFLALPVAFAALWGWGRLRLKERLTPFETFVLLAALAVFLFNNLAPPYSAGPGAQIRGGGWSRLYQPIFVVMVLYALRLAARVGEEPASLRAPVTACLALCLAANLAIALAPVLRSKALLLPYQRFYWHALPEPPETAMYDNLGKYGRKPLGL